MKQIDIKNKKQELTELIQKVLERAHIAGATSAEADVSVGSGLSVTVRMGEVETIEHQSDRSLGITVYVNTQKGNANTTDFSDKAIDETVQAACTIANNAGTDDCAGLLEPQYLAREVPDLDLYHFWDLKPEDAIVIAKECEDKARQTDVRIKNSDGSLVSTYSGTHVYGNSHGFINGWDSSRHILDCTVIAEEAGKMQRDGWYTTARDYHDIEDIKDIKAIGKQAAERALARLGAKKLSTRNVPVIFEAPVASGLFSAFISAISGGALYRQASFLLNKLEKSVFADHIHIYEQPLLRKGIGSCPFDSDGMATQRRDIVKNGILQGYILSAYSARKLGMVPTGNANGVHNLIIEPGDHDFHGLIKNMHNGLLITDMIGFGINQVTGDYSRGASGFWVENGEIQYPVEEITVAGNLADMYQNIVKIGNDVDRRGNIQTGSVLIEKMAIAGS